MKVIKQSVEPALFKSIKFLASALKKDPDDLRFHVTHIRVGSDQYGTSTDGSRLYHCPVPGLDEGFYAVTGNRKGMMRIEKLNGDMDEYSYPEFEDIMKEPNEYTLVSRRLETDIAPGHVSFHAEITRVMGDDNCLNFNFISCFPEGLWEAMVTKDGLPIFFKRLGENPGMIAVVMSQRM